MLCSTSRDMAVLCRPSEAGETIFRACHREGECEEFKLPGVVGNLVQIGGKIVACLGDGLGIVSLAEKKHEMCGEIRFPVAVQRDPFGENRFLVLTKDRVLFACELGKSLSVKIIHEDVDDFAVSNKMIVLRRGEKLMCFSRTESDFLPFSEREFEGNYNLFSEGISILMFSQDSELLETVNASDGSSSLQQHVQNVWHPSVIQTANSLSFRGHKYDFEKEIVAVAVGEKTMAVWHSIDEKPIFVPLFEESGQNQTVNEMEAVANGFIAMAMKMVKANDERMMKRIQEMSDRLQASLDTIQKRADELNAKVDRMKTIPK